MRLAMILCALVGLIAFSACATKKQAPKGVFISQKCEMVCSKTECNQICTQVEGTLK